MQLDIIEETRAPFVTPPDIYLPPFDLNGEFHGAAYEAAKDARTKGLLSTRATNRGLKFKRRFEALALTEFKPLITLPFNPYIVDLREQYPILKPGAFNKAILEGKRMNDRDRMTIDLIVTFLYPSTTSLHTHGISIKSAMKPKLSPKDVRRQDREEQALENIGWTWQFMRSSPYQSEELSNCWVMYRTISDLDVVGQYHSAKEFAEYLLTRSTEGPLASVMCRVARQLGISHHWANQLFCVAVSFGMLRIDHEKPLRGDQTLYLLR